MLDAVVTDLVGAESADLAVAFVLESGLSRVEPYLYDIVERGGTVRVLTGDYLDVTEPRALLRLLDLQVFAALSIGAEETLGTVQCRVFQTDNSIGFHPKGYLIGQRSGERIAYVGSSNLTRAALERGIEWNYRVAQGDDRGAVSAILAEFESLFQHPRTVPLTEEWIEAYRDRRVPTSGKTEPVSIDTKIDAAPPPPTPHAIQLEALEALQKTRLDGNKAGLVVLATGLGKTWLSAFDSENFRRVLFVAHREEILRQALATFRRIRPEAHMGLYTGAEKIADADVLFASIQTLGKTAHLDRFSEDTFDYIVVDEFHHAAASTYRRLIDHFEPVFLLGLTATPERTDGADLLSLCAENLVYRCDLAEGINQDLLSPFQYYGVPDDTDFQNIPWRSGRFDPKELENAVITQSRAENAYRQWRKRNGKRSLGFCVSQRHSDYMAEYFRAKGVKAVSVHAGSTSAPRTGSLKDLESGRLEIVFAVDMFNEGVDVPHIDTVIMLRPTESRILWLQQFGRGLRRAEGKSHVRVIDYVGNHRTFLQPAMLLLPGADSGPGALSMALERLERGELELPAGCSVTYDLEALNILKSLARPSRGSDSTVAWYRSFREQHGGRPTASEAWHSGFDPKSVRKGFGSWFGLVRAEEDFSNFENEVFEAHREFLDALEVTPMTKSYKMIVLHAMLAEESFPGSILIEDLTVGVQHFAQRSQLLEKDFGLDLEDTKKLQCLLEENPIAAWTAGKGTKGGQYFRYENGSFESRLGEQPDHREVLAALVREIADFRVAQYLERLQGEARFAPRIICNVSHANDKPILFLPSRDTTPGIPEGRQPIIANGKEYMANFVKIAVNVVTEPDQTENMLPSILQGWFGEGAGQPGRSQRVVFERLNDRYQLQPLAVDTQQPFLWREYTRAEIPPLWGHEFSPSRWNQGFVNLGKDVFLLVSLEKSGLQEAHQYDDRFITPELFSWVSQNRHSQEGPAGQMLKEHVARDIHVHLFVRATRKTPKGKAAPFTYCGQVAFVDWEGSKPITIRWRLNQALPEYLHSRFGLKSGG